MTAKKAEYLKSLRLEEIRLRKLRVTTGDEIYSATQDWPAKIRFHWDYNSKHINSEYYTSVLLDFTLDIIDPNSEDQRFLFGISCTIEAKYINEHELTRKQFNAFTKNLYITHLWPYVRELVQNTSYRTGIEPILLPPIGRLLRGD